MAWNSSELDLLQVLTHRVRFLSLGQIAGTFWPKSTETTVRNHLVRLTRSQWVQPVGIVCHPELPLPKPLFCWQPGEGEPDYGVLSYRCRCRWSQYLVSQTVYKAGTQALALYGGQKINLRPAQATHDLHVGALYCRLHRQAPEQALQWRLEDSQIILPDERLPDALFFDEQNLLRRIIEFGGAGKPARMAKLHAFGVRYEVSYELW